MTAQPFPDQGELFKASRESKNFHPEALIFFIHFYKGHKKALKRHIQFVNSLGFDAYAFNLKDEIRQHEYLPYSTISKKFGLKHALADQIEEHLNLLTQYPQKIIFAFSNVSACAIEVMARRPDLNFAGLICDSGPAYDFVASAFKLYTYAERIPFWPLRKLVTPILAKGWSTALHHDVPEDLKKLPQGFPVLSIRGWKDPLMSAADMDKIFQPCANLNWQKLSLPEAKHLNGLRDFPDEYKPVVADFIARLDLKKKSGS